MISELDYHIDVPKLLVESTAILEQLKIADLDQILLTHRKGTKGNERFTQYAGSLRNEKGVYTAEFAYLAEEFKGTYIAQVIEDVRNIAATYPKRIGRVRFLRLKPRSCYTLHIDKEEFRFHIPLVTNRSCFFVCGDQIGRMLEVGRLHQFQTNLEHTAVNASLQERTHLVFDTWA